MSEFFSFFIEFSVTFIFVFLIYYFFMIKVNEKQNPDYVPVEVNLILLSHRIDIKKINYNKMLLCVSLLSSFNIALIITILFHFLENVFLVILLSLIIVVPVSLIGYNIIGKYFKKTSVEK